MKTDAMSDAPVQRSDSAEQRGANVDDATSNMGQSDTPSPAASKEVLGGEKNESLPRSRGSLELPTPVNGSVDESGKQDVEAQPPAQLFDSNDYSIFTRNEKRTIVICAGVCSFFSPVSGQIYLPALNQIARDLHVSYDLINLTITVYLIMQGLAPSFIAGLSDKSGRRVAYLCCFVIYIAVNIGLALQSNYAALMVLRCLQSAGSAPTVALANAVVADVVTSQERGSYVSYVSVAPQVGPAIGPIIGGLLAQYLGWHSIFWFLVIVAVVICIPMIAIFPETCRSVVEDGSVPPPKWSRCYFNTRLERRLLREGQEAKYERRDELASKRKVHFPSPLPTFRVLFTKEAGFPLLFIGIVFSAYYAMTALIPSQFGTIYGLNEIKIALCYIPFGAGSFLAGFVRGRMIDARFRTHAKRLGLTLEKNRRMDLSNFPIERARLEVAIPLLALNSALIIGFGWMVQARVNLAGPLIFLFFVGFCSSSSINTVSVLMVDIFPGKAGTASAANNLCRCWLGAATTSGVVPMINKIGIGWTTTFFGLLPFVFSPILWYVMTNGPKWRRAKQEKKDREALEAKLKQESPASK